MNLTWMLIHCASYSTEIMVGGRQPKMLKIFKQVLLNYYHRELAYNIWCAVKQQYYFMYNNPNGEVNLVKSAQAVELKYLLVSNLKH